MDQKISEIKLRNFQPSENKKRREEEQKNPEFEFYTLSLPFTSFRCSNLASQIYKILKNVTPNFKLNIVFSTIKLENIILPRMKPKKTYFNNSNVIYEFECACKQTYVGETKKLLHTRILQHRPTKSSHVQSHTSLCPEYKEKFKDKLFVDPDNAPVEQLRSFLHDHFKILVKGLYNTYHRKVYEGLIITIKRPNINKQFEHKSMSIVCSCVVPRNPTLNSTIGPSVSQPI